jgi:hypothetical protein
MPRAAHPEVAAHGQPVIEADEEVLSARFDRGDGGTDERREIRHAADARTRLSACGGDPSPEERAPQHLSGSEDRVALGHRPILVGWHPDRRMD